MCAGLLFSGPAAAISGIPSDLGPTELGLLVFTGVGNVAGLLLVFAALRVGKVSLVAPISSTEGAIAAILAIAAGEEIGLLAGLMLAVVTVGIVLTGISDEEASAPARWAPAYAFGAALCFGSSLFVTGHLSETLPLVWTTLPARVVGPLLIAVPLVLLGRFRMTREALPLVAVAAVAEVLGFFSFAIGARHGIAISAVLASQFAAISAIAAYFLFHERITRVQLAGVLVIALGVAVLSALQV